MTSIAVLIPVLNRPHRAKVLVDSLAGAAGHIRAWPYFLISPGDTAEEEAVSAAGAHYAVMGWEAGRGDYARKMNFGFATTNDEYVFLGADDLVFHRGWAERAIAVQKKTGVCVVGTNDLGNARVYAGDHSTHSLIHRGYGECGTIDDEHLILHEGYWHNFVDDELVQTAKFRDTYFHARDVIVEHLHPNWGKGVQDETYKRGQLHFQDDRVHFDQRSRLWQ